MMKLNNIILLFLLFILQVNVSGIPIHYHSKKNHFQQNSLIIIKLKFISGSQHVSTITFSPIDYIGNREWKVKQPTIENGTLNWTIEASEPTYLEVGSVYKKKLLFVAEPGDSISIISDGKNLQFSGRGAEKYRLKYEMDIASSSIPRPKNPVDYKTESLQDYLEWNSYLNTRLETVVPLIDSYKNVISNFSYHYIRASYIDQIIDDRSDKFYTFLSYARSHGYSNSEISAIYDSTYRLATKDWFKYTASKIYGNTNPITFEIFRKYSFDNKSKDFKTNYSSLFQEIALNHFNGIQREKFLADIITKGYIKQIGFTAETETHLINYYADSSFPEYKKYVKEFEARERERVNGKKASEFSLIDTKGQEFTKENLKGKIAVFDFWFTGCVGCVSMASAMKEVENVFKDDTNVVFINVSVDKNKNTWLNGIKQKMYTTGSGINLYTGGKGADHDMVRKYAITGFPTLHLMDPFGRIIRMYPNPDPRRDNGKSLIKIIKKQLSLYNDGPYIIHEKDNDLTYYINGSSLLHKKINRKDSPTFSVQTDDSNTFSLKLKRELTDEPGEFPQNSNLFILSDIEGNFEALRKLLLANKIIDESYNWTFGNGHLVFNGDMFDRGSQVTECLWLLYSLEEKAKAAGGYVHYILGNHEIMNLYGNHKYTQAKYKANEKLIGISLQELYGEKTELGKWLRTKNVIEKIGDLLFVHGGIAKEFADSISLSISDINSTARKYYGQKVDEWRHKEKDVRLIYSTSYSPFWYRTYYDESDKHLWLDNDHSIVWTIKKPNEFEMSKILEKYKVKRIITGHTIIADTISVHYNGKLINTDTKHAEGKSEALLIENEKYYRVNATGEKTELILTEPGKSSFAKYD